MSAVRRPIKGGGKVRVCDAVLISCSINRETENEISYASVSRVQCHLRLKQANFFREVVRKLSPGFEVVKHIVVTPEPVLTDG